MKNTLKIIGLFFLITTLSFTKVDEKIVVLDVSHGGKDNGGVSNGINEKDITLSIAHRVMALGNKKKIKIILTRATDKFLSLEERVAFINTYNPNYLISLHVNSSDNKTKNGFEFYVDEKKGSAELAQRVINNLPNEVKLSAIQQHSFYLLKNTKCPVAIVEMGFLTNEEDKQYLLSDDGQNKIAKAIYQAIK